MKRLSLHAALMGPMLLLTLVQQSRCQALAAPMQQPNMQFFDCRQGTCNPLAGGFLFSYIAGTTTPLATCATTTLSGSSCSSPNSNPVVLNSSGFNAAGSGSTGIWPLPARCYKFTLKDSASVTLWTIDAVCNQTGLLQAALAASSGAGLMGFSQSASYSAGTVGTKLQQTISITDPPFNGVCDGTADTTNAWIAALAFIGSTGGTINIPGNKTCYTATGIVINNSASVYIRIVGAGDSSVIKCTGVACITWSNAAARDSGMSDLMISDPTGSASTVGLFLEGTNVCCSQTRLRFQNMTIRGASGNPLGIGIKLHNVVLPDFIGVNEFFFGEGGLQTGFVNSHWLQSSFHNNLTRGFDTDGAAGDTSMSQMDFEDNPIGVYGASSPLSITQSHFESNATNHFEVTSGILVSEGNTFAGGTALVDANAQFASTYDQMSGFSLVNNSSSGAASIVPVNLYSPRLGPSAITGTGWSRTCSALGCFDTGSASAYTQAGSNTYNIGAHITGGATLTAMNFGNATDNNAFNFLGLGTTTFTGKVTAPFLPHAINEATECAMAGTGCSGASANNVLTASLLDSGGNIIATGNNATIILSTTHTLQSGANTLNVNNTGDLPILRQRDGGNISQAWSASREIFINVSGSFWFLVGAQ